MADNGRTGLGERSLTSLVSGIFDDLQELTRQQFALFKAEVKSDLRKTAQVAVSWAAAFAGIAVGALLLVLTVVHLLAYYTSIPLWGCYGLVGVVVLAAGAALFYAGKKKLESFSLLPDESLEALKENVQCLTNPRN